MSEYVIIKDMSGGNETVGEMWQETKVFNGNSTLDDVMDWANQSIKKDEQFEYSRKRITITRPHSD